MKSLMIMLARLILRRRRAALLARKEIPVAAYKDLLTTLTTDLATQASAGAALTAATLAKTHSDADVASDTLSFAQAVHSAPGGFVVDATGTTVTLYQSADGVTFMSTVIASITDPVPSVPPAP